MRRNLRGRIENLEAALGVAVRLSAADRRFLAEHPVMPADGDPAQRRWVELAVALSGGTWAALVRSAYTDLGA